MKESREEKRQFPLRVVQACDLQAGGIATFILAVCGQLDRKKVNFDYLVYRSQKEFGEEMARELGGRKLVADDTNAPNKAVKFLWRFFRTWKTLKRERVQIFHVNAPTPYDCLAGLAAKLAGVKVVIIHAHNSQLKKTGKLYRAAQAVCRFCIPLFGDYYFACSDLAGKFMFGKKLQEKVIYIKNGISVEKFRFRDDIRLKMRKVYGIRETLVVGSVGRFCKQKNQHFLLEIFAEVLRICPDASLLLIGQGELQEELMRYAKELQIDAHLIHIASTDRVQDYLNMMDVFLLPSLFEGLPVVGIEAQANGLPCLFSDTITGQVAVTGRAYFMDINLAARQWAEFAVKAAKGSSKDRNQYADKVREAGYEIQDTASWLQEFYLGL